MKESFDLILMDLNMHVMNGFESCKMIKQSLLTSQVQTYIVAISASEFDKQLVQQCIQCSFDAWYTVPISAQVLQEEVIEKVLLLKEI